MRTPDKREQRLGSYALFQRSGPLQAGVWDKMMRGLSTRNYGAVVKDFHNAYGVEKSAVSENFIQASREKVKQLMERPLDELRLCAVLIDGTPFKDRQMVAALGIGCDGTKTVLGIREGAIENTAAPQFVYYPRASGVRKVLELRDEPDSCDHQSSSRRTQR